MGERRARARKPECSRITLPEAASTGVSLVASEQNLVHVDLRAVLTHQPASNLCRIAAAASRCHLAQQTYTFNPKFTNMLTCC